VGRPGALACVSPLDSLYGGSSKEVREGGGDVRGEGKEGGRGRRGREGGRQRGLRGRESEGESKKVLVSSAPGS
jgi:hypothetical protein